jgi:hypothetical protein
MFHICYHRFRTYIAVDEGLRWFKFHFQYTAMCAYRRGFVLDDLIYCTLYIHTTGVCRQYSAIVYLQPLHTN